MARRPFQLIVALSVYQALKRLARPERKRLAAAIVALTKGLYLRRKRGRRLRGRADQFLRLRVGDYRVMYEAVGDEVRVLGLVHRKDLERWIKEL